MNLLNTPSLLLGLALVSAPLAAAEKPVNTTLFGNLAVNGNASYGFVDFTSDRRLTIGTLTDRVKGEWSGQSYTGAIRAAYTLPFGWFDAKPFVAADYIGFQQDGYQETAAGMDELALVVGDSDASLATASYGILLESLIGSEEAFAFRPHVSVGYRNILGWDSTPAAMRFVGNSAATSF